MTLYKLTFGLEEARAVFMREPHRFETHVVKNGSPVSVYVTAESFLGAFEASSSEIAKANVPSHYRLSAIEVVQPRI